MQMLASVMAMLAASGNVFRQGAHIANMPRGYAPKPRRHRTNLGGAKYDPSKKNSRVRNPKVAAQINVMHAKWLATRSNF